MDLRAWYIATYKDRFFTAEAPAWFWLFTVMEAVYHVPMSLYAVWGLWKGKGKSWFSDFAQLCYT